MISVVIPTYNNLALCQQAVASVLKQRGCEYEVIVVDDSTERGIEEYISGLQSDRIRYFHNDTPLGAVPNWNRGLRLASGEAVVLLHHDEAFESDQHLATIEQMLKDSDAVVCAKRVMLGDRQKRERYPAWLKRYLMQRRTPVLGMNYIGPSACVAVRRELAEEFDERLRWLVDVEWYYRMLSKARRVDYAEGVRVISSHGSAGQITGSIDIVAVLREDKAVIKEKYRSCGVNFWLSVESLRQWIKKLIR